MLNSHITVRDSWPLIDGNPIPYLNCLRDAKSAASSYPPDRVPRPRGKIEFARFVAANDGLVPRTFALIAAGMAQAAGVGAAEPVREFLQTLAPGQYFCKPNKGSNGTGAFRLDISPSGAGIDGEPRSLAEIEEAMSARDYLVQEWLTSLQHPDVSSFHDGVIDTLRLVTFDTDGGPVAAGALMRMAIGPAVIDSWTKGGVMVPIDLDRGVLGAFGLLKKGLAIVDSHPQSGIAFRGQSVPHLKEAVALACRLQKRLAIKSVGWDIALLTDGPCILEGNRAWDVYMSAQLNPDFVRAFLRFHLPQESDTALRVSLTGSFEQRHRLRHWLCAAVGRALASAEVDQLSRDRLVLTVTGAKTSVEAAIGNMRKPEGFAVATIETSPCPDQIPAGLDIGATFAPI